MKEQIKLKPCPFCGSEPKIIYKDIERHSNYKDRIIMWWEIYCDKCELTRVERRSEYKIDPMTEELILTTKLVKDLNSEKYVDVPAFDGHSECVRLWNERIS